MTAQLLLFPDPGARVVPHAEGCARLAEVVAAVRALLSKPES